MGSAAVLACSSSRGSSRGDSPFALARAFPSFVAQARLRSCLASPRCAEALPSKASLHNAPRSRTGSSLLNERHDSRTALTIILDAVREYERTLVSTAGPTTPLLPRPHPPPPRALQPLQAHPRVPAAPPRQHQPADATTAHTHVATYSAGSAAPDESKARIERSRLKLRGLLDQLELIRVEQGERIARDNSDAISLDSIHGAKGLEWPLVFCVSCPLLSFGHPCSALSPHP